MRIIFGIIAFTLTFGLSAGLVGLLFGFPQASERSFSHNHYSDSVYTHKIKRLLKRDIRNGEMRNQKIYRLESNGENFGATAVNNPEYSIAVNNYYESSAGLNDANLPEDFKYAWREHMNAWKKQVAYVKSIQHHSSRDDLGSPAVTFSDNTNEINQTWFQVLRIAERYGVSIDRRFYR